MARGKQTCKILKEIRRQIAAANNIEFITSECRYKGDCPGTCPKCEAEVRYLEEQLRARSLSGKAVALAGISAGMMLMSCGNGTPAAQPGPASQSDTAGPAPQSASTLPTASFDSTSGWGSRLALCSSRMSRSSPWTAWTTW